MAGNQAGGRKAAATNIRIYGRDFYKRIGAAGGKISRGGGFASSHELAVEAGRKGGKASRRPKKEVSESRAVYTPTPSPKIIKAFMRTVYECPRCFETRFPSIPLYQAHYWDTHIDTTVLEADK